MRGAKKQLTFIFKIMFDYQFMNKIMRVVKEKKVDDTKLWKLIVTQQPRGIIEIKHEKKMPK
jgi:hypothetical protein